jgi:hypothetical protein
MPAAFLAVEVFLKKDEKTWFDLRLKKGFTVISGKGNVGRDF